MSSERVSGGQHALLILSPDAVIESCNAHLLDLLGREMAETQGVPISTLFPDQEHADAFVSRLARELAGREFIEGTLRLKAAGGGGIVPLSFQATRMRVPRMGHECYVVIAQDEREAQERRTDLQKAARFSEEIPFPALRISRDGLLQYANRGSWMLLAHWQCEVGQAVPPAWRDHVQETLRRRENLEVEVQIGFKTLLLILVPVHDSDYVDIFGLDVTQRRQVERKLLIHSQVFESATEGIVITDADRRIVDVNKAFTTITGYSADEILGEDMSVLQSGRHDEEFYRQLWADVNERGSWQGEIWDRRKNGDIHPKWLSISAVTEEGGRIVRYIGLFSDISVMKQTQEQLYRMAHYDSLTGLPNRRFFHDRLQGDIEQARRSRENLALMFIDLDGFKLINDNLGHRAGDQLLQEVAGRIKECVRESDMVARMGGDEFTVILSQLKSSHSTVVVAQKILKRIYEPVMLEGQELFVSSSLGISIYPDDADDVQGLLQSADTALYKAKELGKNGYQFFSREMNQRAMERLTMQTQIRQGIANREFLVYYQPQFEAATGKLAGLEALARWQSPVIGLVGPDQFIPLAEETGLIHDLGEVVLRVACTQGRKWRDEGLPPLRISINISPHQLRRADFVSAVESVADECGFPMEQLVLELTESVLIEDNPHDLEKLQRLKARGALLAIDDFGTKYSSFAYLRRLPIDRLKIDRSFVQDISSDARGAEIASAIIAMSRSLNLEVVAEGVETKEQAALLTVRGCQYLQGYFCGRPLPPNDIRMLLAREGPAAHRAGGGEEGVR
jgi:diguanylate cyclase (GGDEF)-like protein/PAS domain S-box-containing protein